MEQRKQGKPKAVWVARETTDFGGASFYFLCRTKPRSLFYGMANRDWLETFCPDKFERITGFKLEPGECKRVTITVKEVKEAK